MAYLAAICHTCRTHASRSEGLIPMEYTITPLTPHTGAEVRGIDLNEVLMPKPAPR